MGTVATATVVEAAFVQKPRERIQASLFRYDVVRSLVLWPTKSIMISSKPVSV
jgi:hypothetical protein